ncbi:MAG: PLP-dependent cysteine synthase family protein [Mycobacterium leprae]
MLGPTFEEMLHPSTMNPAVRERAIAAKKANPLDPINLYNISWRDLATNRIWYEVIPQELTGVETPIVVLYGKEFPTGAHKVGAAYSVLAEMTLLGEVDPKLHTVVWPSTGNYGIGGAWVAGRMGTPAIVVLPEQMSRERFELIESYGARVIKTKGCESNVKEIYDMTWELRKDPKIRILNQFEVMGNYRFHYHVTGNTIAELAVELHRQGIGKGHVSAYCSAMGSAGTIAAGDRVKQVWPDAKIVGLEPIQCPTLYNNGYGGHDIQGIGDKHVTWIHNVLNMDAIICLDDIECKKGLQFLTEEPGMVTLKKQGVPEEKIRQLSSIFGISGVCNLLGAIKTVKHYGLGKDDLVVTICTDAIDRYRSVMTEMTQTYGRMDEVEAAVRLATVFHGQKTDWIREGTGDTRRQWHNLKYYTWVEQQGKTVAELDAQLNPEWWQRHQQMVPEIDSRIRSAR